MPKALNTPAAPAGLAPLLLLAQLGAVLLTLSLVVHLSATPDLPTPPLTGAVFRAPRASTRLPPAFVAVNAVLALPHPLRHTVLVSDVATNALYHLHTNMPAFAAPLLNNAGGAATDADAAALRRPGVAGMAVYDASASAVRVVLARNAARDVALLSVCAPPTSGTSLLPDVERAVTIADSFNGSRLNAPHSLHVDAAGNIFFSDPTFGLIAAADEFDRALDAPDTMEQPAQNVYYVPAQAVQEAVQSGVPASPRLLVDGLDRPAGVAVVRNRLFVAMASPRRPVLADFELNEDADGGLQVAGEMRVLHDWSKDLHGWGQKWFSGVLGHLCLVGERWLFIGAGNGLAVFDTTKRFSDGEMLAPVDCTEIEVPPGPPSAVMAEDGYLYVAASDRIIKLDVALPASARA